MSLPAPSVIKPRPLSALGVDDPGTTSGGDIEKYAQDNLNLNCRVKGLKMLFRKKASVRDILSWTKDPIPQPMLVVVDGEKSLKKEALNLFRLVQVWFLHIFLLTFNVCVCFTYNLSVVLFSKKGHICLYTKNVYIN